MKFLIQEFRPDGKPDQVRCYLRLEKDGVFQGWAVPKGIPAQAGVKRLAIPVGDYRLEQADFEGPVKKSLYGPGRISIRDRGEYRPIKWTKDKILIRLNGEKAKETYKLVFVEFEKSGEKNWLLEKVKDEAPTPPAPVRSQRAEKSAPRTDRSVRLRPPRLRPRRKYPKKEMPAGSTPKHSPSSPKPPIRARLPGEKKTSAQSTPKQPPSTPKPPKPPKPSKPPKPPKPPKPRKPPKPPKPRRPGQKKRKKRRRYRKSSGGFTTSSSIVRRLLGM